MKFHKASFLLCFVFLIYDGKLVSCFNLVPSKSSNLAKAVNEVVNEVLADLTVTVNLVSPKNEKNLSEFKDEFLLNSFTKSKVGYRQQASSKLKPSALGHKKRFSIIVIEDFNEFMEIYEKIATPKIFWFSGFYVVALNNGKISEIQEMFKLMWKLQIFNVNVMFEDEKGDVLVETFMLFNERNCNDTTPIPINKFRDGKFMNGTENFFPNKMKNLHNCPIRVSISKSDEPFIFSKLLPNGSYEVSGSDINLINSLSSALNFNVDYAYIGDEGYFYENGTADGPLKALLDGKVDLSMSGWWLKENRLQFFDHTVSHISDQIIFVIPPGRDLSAFELLIFPFSNTLWIMVLLCFAVGFVVIFVIRRRSREVQGFVFGTGVRHPYLNVIVGFFGGSQTKLPRRNFARYLLIMFLMYSLVIRTLYQASYFQLLKSNIKRGEVQSIDEMVQEEFNFYVYYGIEDLVNATGAIKNRFGDFTLFSLYLSISFQSHSDNLRQNELLLGENEN